MIIIPCLYPSYDNNGMIITDYENKNACRRLSSFSAVGPLSLKPPPDYHRRHNDNDNDKSKYQYQRDHLVGQSTT